jgi:hypothetical protein
MLRPEFAGVLEQVNKIRQRYNLPMLEDFEKGSPQSAKHCPISNSVMVNSNFDHVTTTHYTIIVFETDEICVPYPVWVAEFISQMDSYKLPEYRG